MKINKQMIDRFLEGKTKPAETIEVLSAIAIDPALQEYVVTRRRIHYADEQMEDYGSFIPASGMAAADGQNLCDFQCEAYILSKEGIDFKEDALAQVSRNNYWLRAEGTPLFNMGKLLEKNGLLVNRRFGASLQDLKEALSSYHVVIVVNGDILLDRNQDILADGFDFNDNPNHAVTVLSISEDEKSALLYNPETGNKTDEYPLTLVLEAWKESSNYMVTARAKRFPQEYNPQPVDVSKVSLNAELLDLTEMIAENAHDVWAVRKMAKGFTYDPVDIDDGENRHSHFLVPYFMLSEEDKQPDIEMAIGTIKLLKRLGYRLVNINSMHKCPSCGSVIEPDHNFCSNCGRELSWEDFK